MQPTLRIATEEDLPFIVDVYNSTVPGRMVTADLEPVTVNDRKTWFHSHQVDKRPVWIIESNGSKVGWAAYSNFYGRPAYDITAELSLYLAPSSQGKRIGDASLPVLLDKAAGLGIVNVLGFIFGHNEPSLKLFRKHGFETWGNLPDVALLDGVSRDLVILGRRVTARESNQ